MRKSGMRNGGDAQWRVRPIMIARSLVPRLDLS